MTVPAALFSRKQLGDLARLDDTTLNYWSREGILRPAEGGAGRGSHRRFAYHEVNLAALLAELRKFGIGAPDLKGLADRFHAAVDFIDGFGIGRTSPYWDSAFDLFLARKRIEREGFYEQFVRGDDEFPGLPRHGEYDHLKSVRLDWAGVVQMFQAAKRAAEYSDEVVRIVAGMDLHAFDEHHLYYRTVTAINDRKPDEEVSTEPDYYFRSADGQWAMHPDKGLAAREAISFIGVDMERLTYRMWHGQ